MIRVRFLNADGSLAAETVAAPGARLLDLAQALGLPLEGTCEGAMACSTCHVIVEKGWFDRLPEEGEEEEDMLDLAAGVQRTSRLSCQIALTGDLDGLEVRIPAESHDLQGV